MGRLTGGVSFGCTSCIPIFHKGEFQKSLSARFAQRVLYWNLAGRQKQKPTERKTDENTNDKNSLEECVDSGDGSDGGLGYGMGDVNAQYSWRV